MWGLSPGRGLSSAGPSPTLLQQLLLVVLRARGALPHLLVPFVGQGLHLDAPIVQVLGQTEHCVCHCCSVTCHLGTAGHTLLRTSSVLLPERAQPFCFPTGNIYQVLLRQGLLLQVFLPVFCRQSCSVFNNPTAVCRAWLWLCSSCSQGHWKPVACPGDSHAYFFQPLVAIWMAACAFGYQLQIRCLLWFLDSFLFLQ